MTRTLPSERTGVARGNLGTGTALDDTQVYDVADLVGPALPGAASAAAAAQAPERARPAPAIRRPRRTATSPARRDKGLRPPVRSTSGLPGAAWLLGTAAVAVLATAIVIGGAGGGPVADGASSAPAAILPGIMAPTAAPTKAAGDGGGGNGNGHGNGNGRGPH